MVFPSPLPVPVFTVEATVSVRVGKHRAAIALNNNAVSLLNRSCYQEALDIFKDALKLIKSATVRSNDAAAQIAEREISAEDINLALRGAWQRTALCKKSTSPNASTDGVVLNVISSECNPTSIRDELMSSAAITSNHVQFPMAIDPIDFEDCDDDDVDFQSGVILYNYGIAYDCLAAKAESNCDDSAKKMLQVKAYRIFQMTSALLSKLSQNDWNDTSASFTSRLLVLKTFLTHNLIQASIQLNLLLEYHKNCESMEELMLFMEVQNLLLPTPMLRVASAA